MKKLVLIVLLVAVKVSAFAQNSKNGQAQKSFNNAQSYLDKGAYEDAVIQLKAAINFDPQFQIAYLQLGDVLRRLKSYDKSKATYLQALTLSLPVDARVY
jgi:Tfp pilus assembly protein PilF